MMSQHLLLALASLFVASTTVVQSTSPPATQDVPLPKSVDDLLALQAKMRAVVDRVRAATVGMDGASGVIVSEDGYVLSAAHVVKSRKDKVRITLHDGRSVEGVACGLNWDDDVALVKIPGNGPWPFVELATGNKTRPGSWCLAIGHPGGFRIGRGLVVRAGRVLLTTARSVGADVSTTGGDSGGPLFDLEGRVLGILSSPLDAAPIDGVVVGTFGLRYASARVIRKDWSRLAKGEVWGKLYTWPKNHEIRTERARSNPRLFEAFRPVVAQARECTVRVRCDGKDVALGTIVGPDGWVLTRHGALSERVEVVIAGKAHRAKIIGVARADDLAMLKVDARGLATIPLAKDHAPRPGTVLASAGTRAEPLAYGVVSVAARDQRKDRFLLRPSFDLPFRITANFERNAGRFETRGVRIWKDSPPDASDVRPGDILQSVDGHPIPTRGLYREATRALRIALKDRTAGQTIALTVRRAGRDVAAKALLQTPALRLVGRYPSVLQHDAHVSSTQCGGPVVDLDGNCVGIQVASQRKRYHYESYAVPAARIRQLLFDLASGHLAPRREHR